MFNRVLLTIMLLASMSLAIFMNLGCGGSKHPNGTYTNDTNGVISSIEFKSNGTMSATNSLGTQTYKWKMVGLKEISIEREDTGEIFTLKYEPEVNIVTLEEKQFTKPAS